jgi:hypothetical protein
VRAVDRGQWTNLPLPAPLKAEVDHLNSPQVPSL